MFSWNMQSCTILLNTVSRCAFKYSTRGSNLFTSVVALDVRNQVATPITGSKISKQSEGKGVVKKKTANYGQSLCHSLHRRRTLFGWRYTNVPDRSETGGGGGALGVYPPHMNAALN
jgi:hypothetical protein